MKFEKINLMISNLPLPFKIKLFLLILTEIIYNFFYLQNIPSFEESDIVLDKDYNGQVVIVTGMTLWWFLGANSGIGFEISKTLAKLKFKVILGNNFINLSV